MAKVPNKFKAATWNMGGGEANGGPTDAQVEEVLAKIKSAKVSVFLGQETQEKHDRAVLRAMGFQIYHPDRDTLVAWDPRRWRPLAKECVTLNPESHYYRVGGKTPVYSKMAEVILGDALGRTVRVGSYHLPSSVQQANAPDNRLAATRESMEVMARRAKRTKTHAVLYGGDDNVEESGAYGPWGFMLEDATGLRQVTAPSNTLGRRKVDDFRVADLNVLRGQMVKGPTHHNAHLRTFKWRA